MSRTTGIEWTDATWNPIRGCSRVSEGCRNCYAETVANRFCGPGSPYEGVVQIGADGKGLGKWNGHIKFVEKHLLDPLRWKPIFLKCEVCGVTQYQCLCEEFNHRSRRIFVNSMSDLFHENVTDEMLDKIFAVMALCPQHTFQVLTKRPERMLDWFNERWQPAKEMRIGGFVIPAEVEGESRLCQVEREADGILEGLDLTDPDKDELWTPEGSLKAMQFGWPLPNVHLGVSVENQAAADERIPLLLQTSAAKRFISAEPLLGPIDLTKVMDRRRPKAMQRNVVEAKDANPAHDYLVQSLGADYPYERLDGVIVGGESGPGARPMHPEWARSLRDQCVAAGVPFFFKQWGEWASVSEVPGPGIHHHFPDGATVRRVGKHAAGRLLDGREWNEMPA